MPRYSSTGKNISAAAHSGQGHYCSCGRTIFGNGYSRHRLVCPNGRWLDYRQWIQRRDV